MKTKKVIYWISTILICALMVVAAIAYLGHQPAVMQAFTSLGYPNYFPNMLGIAKLLGVIALLVPGFPILKEWAYAGFVFTFVAAFISHLTMNQNQQAIAPVIAIILLAISYWTRPATRIAPHGPLVFGKVQHA